MLRPGGMTVATPAGPAATAGGEAVPMQLQPVGSVPLYAYGPPLPYPQLLGVQPPPSWAEHLMSGPPRRAAVGEPAAGLVPPASWRMRPAGEQPLPPQQQQQQQSAAQGTLAARPPAELLTEQQRPSGDAPDALPLPLPSGQSYDASAAKWGVHAMVPPSLAYAPWPGPGGDMLLGSAAHPTALLALPNYALGSMSFLSRPSAVSFVTHPPTDSATGPAPPQHLLSYSGYPIPGWQPPAGGSQSWATVLAAAPVTDLSGGSTRPAPSATTAAKPELVAASSRESSPRAASAPWRNDGTSGDRRQGVAHVCGVCAFRFLSKADLGRHKLVHTGEKPHVCATCGRRFRQKGTLKTHEHTHTGEKPYMCGFCNTPFRHRNALRLHRLRLHRVNQVSGNDRDDKASASAPEE